MEENQGARNECKICGKRFKCGRSLGGHMRSHLIGFSFSDHRKTGNQLLKNGANEERKQCGRSSYPMFGHKEEDSLLSSTEQVMDSHSENESTTPLCRRKRLNRGKRYETSTNSSSDLTVAISNDQLEKEEVALSLLLLSNNHGVDTGVDSFGNYLQSNSAQVDTVQVPTKGFISDHEHPKVATANSSHDETLIKKPRRKRNLRHFIDRCNVSSNTSEYASNSEKKSKFLCVFCLKVFPSCQALGGHRASHMRFKGSCSMRDNGTSTELETSATDNKGFNLTKQIKTSKNNKVHECPICFTVFASGQALGGHKRSHSTTGKSRITADPPVFDVPKQIRHFLDLNMPGPAEEETTQVKAMTYKGYQHT